IQHRIYVTSYLRKQIDERGLAEGRGFGRIWRITPDGAPKPNFKSLALGTASTAALVNALTEPNGWTRDTAQRLLVEKHDSSANAALAKLATDSASPALARLQALWTLEGTGGLNRATLLAALNDSDPHVCAAAVRLSEQPDPELTARVVALVATRKESE